MKRTLLALSLIAASSAVFAGGIDNSQKSPSTSELTVCNGDATSGRSAVYGTTDGTTLTSTTYFVQQSFSVQCSANTIMSIQEVSPTLAVVASASKKGDSIFIGSTSGGSVAADSITTKCTGTNNSCSTTDVTKGLTDAQTLASSSGSGG